jgi:uncharacterized membrane protein
MKKAGILLGFVPLIVYGVLAGGSASSAILALAAATIVTVLTGWHDLQKHLILSWTNLVLFGSTFVAVGILGMDWIIPYMGVLIYAILAAVTFGSIFVGRPFTLQYAREMVDKSIWDNPRFIRVNILMTSAWGVVFMVNLGLSAIILLSIGPLRGVFQVVTYAVLVAGIIFTLWYPVHIRKKYTPQIPDSN